MELYREIILDHYHDPRNRGRLDHPTATGTAKNPLCGDELTLDVEVKDGIVRKVAFDGVGCAISQASASLLTEEMKGKTPDQLHGLSRDDVFRLLGGPVSQGREKCALLVLSGLDAALKQST